MYVLVDNEVYTVENENGMFYAVEKCGVNYHFKRHILKHLCTPITKEVADCMLACDPPQQDIKERYAYGWTDPKGVFK